MDPNNQQANQPQYGDDSSALAGQSAKGDLPMASNQANPPVQPLGPNSDEIVTEIPLPAEAEDLDLIEKEWVHRAKQIVTHTMNDPYEQQRALSQMKADYLKKRYGKDIKVADD